MLVKLKAIALLLIWSLLFPIQASESFESSSPEKIASLKSYLTQPTIPQQVRALAEVGIRTYADANSEMAQARENVLAREIAYLGGGTGGGRTYNTTWIEATFGQSEDTLMEVLRNIDPPQTWTIGQINDLYTQLTVQSSSSDIPVFFTVIEGVGSNYIQNNSLGKDCILQVASQFDYRESPGKQKRPVSRYATDRTQGPQASIEAAAAALHRAAAEDAGKLPNALHNILLDTPEIPANSYYEQGYLEPSTLTEEQCEAVYNAIKEKINELEILPQWVICEATGAQQLQIFTAAASFQGKSMPEVDSWGDKLCKLLVSEQYGAIAKISVIHSILTQKSVPLHLTLVGQGAFKNLPSVMSDAFERVANAVRGHNVQVYVHGFNEKDQNFIFDSADKAGIQIKETISREDFLLKTVD